MAVSENRSIMPRRKALASIVAAAVAAGGFSPPVAASGFPVSDGDTDAALLGLWRLWMDASDRMAGICREQDTYSFCAGIDRDTDPVAEARYDELEDQIDGMISEMSAIERAIVDAPAASVVGIAVKLAMWRNMQFIDLSEQEFTTQAVDSAYRDILRFLGCETAAEAIFNS